MKGTAKTIVALPLAACGGGFSATTSTGSDAGTATETTASSDFDAAGFYEGTWRAAVDTTGNTVYGNVSGKEQMLDVIVNADGTCEVAPLEGHEDLLTDTGTWEGTETELTLHLTDGDTTLTVVDDTTLEGDPIFFGIDGFDTLEFVLY